MIKRIIVLQIAFMLGKSLQAQILTKEDSLSAGLIASNTATVLSGYGSFNYANNVTMEDSKINLDRVVLFVGHKFNNRVSFFSEMELEDAKIAGGTPSGEISMEQAFIKFNINRSNYIVSGLFIPRIGIINENHLPTTFNGNSRPMVERLIIPATWRELGIGYYGTSRRIPGLNYTLAVVNGLSSANFESGNGIREGRFEGNNASASAIAITGSLLHYYKNFRTQFSAYYGGTAGITKREADSLQLKSGLFGTPVGLLEADIQYHSQKWIIKGLATFVAIPDARAINVAYANNTAQQHVGAYGELAYNLTLKNTQIFRPFVRFEALNLNYKTSSNGIYNGALKQKYLVAGLGFQPARGVLVKLDYTYRLTGNDNSAIDAAQSYATRQSIINFGVGYSF